MKYRIWDSENIFRDEGRYELQYYVERHQEWRDIYQSFDWNLDKTVYDKYKDEIINLRGEYNSRISMSNSIEVLEKLKCIHERLMADVEANYQKRIIKEWN